MKLACEAEKGMVHLRECETRANHQLGTGSLSSSLTKAYTIAHVEDLHAQQRG